MLLYLNEDTFNDGQNGDTAMFVRAAMENGATMVLVQELDDSKGHCAFRKFFEVTPTDLLKNKLYNTLAVSLRKRLCDMYAVDYACFGYVLPPGCGWKDDQ